METIKNVINFDSEALEKRYDAAMERYEKDPRYAELYKKRELSRRTHYVCMFLSVCSAVALTALFAGPGNPLFALVPAAILFISLLLARKNLFVRARIAEEGIANYNTFFSPALDYYALVNQRTILACYGKPLDDCKFEVTVVVRADEDDKENGLCDSDENTIEDSFIFNYDDRNREGVLTLDVGNEVVFYAPTCHSIPERA